MATVKILALGDLRSEMTHIQSGSKILTDAPTDNHGRGEFFSPTDLVAAALGGCILTVMDIAATRLNISLKGTEIDVKKVMVDNPRRIGEIFVDIYFPQDYSDKEKTILERTAATCPVGKSLHPDIKEVVSFHYRAEKK